MPDATVYVVDDDPGIRMSTERLLTTARIGVKTFSSGREFLDAYDAERPGCVVSDIRMPEMSGIELQEELSRRGYEVPVIVITGYADVPKAVRSMKAGAVEFLEKPVPPQFLLERIKYALDIDEENRCRRDEERAIRARMEKLTRREREVMGHIVEGKTSRVIADELSLSPKTIDVHRAEVMRKMGAKSIAQLTSLVVRARMYAAQGAQIRDRREGAA